MKFKLVLMTFIAAGTYTFGGVDTKAQPHELNVMASVAFKEPYLRMVETFEQNFRASPDYSAERRLVAGISQRRSPC